MVLWGIMKKLKLTYKQEVNGEENQRKDWENWEILRFQDFSTTPINTVEGGTIIDLRRNKWVIS